MKLNKLKQGEQTMRNKKELIYHMRPLRTGEKIFNFVPGADTVIEGNNLSHEERKEIRYFSKAK